MAVVVMMATPSEAQSDVVIRGFADVGLRTFAAAESFKAVLGSNRGIVLGGGAEVQLPWGIFTNVRASRLLGTGMRLFIFNGQQSDLGIPTTVTVTSVELTGGYRFDFSARAVPYAGAGVGRHRYRETSEFAEPDENVNERFTGYHILGGVDVRAARWVGAAFEAQWVTVPDALGSDPNSISSEFNETDMGGVTVRVKVVIGR